MWKKCNSVIAPEEICLEMYIRKLFSVIEVFNMLIRMYTFVKSNKIVCLKVCGFYYTEILRKKK